MAAAPLAVRRSPRSWAGQHWAKGQPFAEARSRGWRPSSAAHTLVMATDLPIDAQLPALLAAVEEVGAAVLVAAPGAGKSTRVAPALLPSVSGQVLLLQPRRIAARSLAARLSDERGEALGGTVGYQVRHDKVGDGHTRLWVLTEGILTRRLQHDPYLEGVGAVILDEFHERSLQVDVALAWCNELRRTIRPDLRLVVMSATIDPQPVADFLGGCPVVASAGRAFPVATHYQAPAQRQGTVDALVAGVERAWAEDQQGGDVLAFLPGVGEISSAVSLLRSRLDGPVLPLHGSLPPAEQDAALRPDSRRRVIIATNVAETSLTIPGVSAVVDSGFHRVARFDAERGLEVLRLERISRWNAEQRAGRAGRTGPGWCLRLWSRLEDQRLTERPLAEIAQADLAPLCLQLRQIHGDDLRQFPWFEAPEAQALESAEALLSELGLIRVPFGPVSERGRYISGLPLHPRLACLLLRAEALGCLGLGAAVAAIVSEGGLRRRDASGPAAGQYADIEYDLDILAGRAEGHGPARRQAELSRRDLLRAWGSAGNDNSNSWQAADLAQLPDLLLAAYPDRVAKRSAPNSNRLQWAGGSGELAESSCAYLRPGRSGEALCLAYGVRGISGRSQNRTVIDGAAPIDAELIRRSLPEAWKEGLELRWNEAKQRVEGARVTRVGRLVIAYEAGAALDPQAASACFYQQLLGFWQQLVEQRWPAAWGLCLRLRWLAQQAPGAAFPNPIVCPAAAAQFVGHWAQGCWAVADLTDPLPQLMTAIGWQRQAELERLAPPQISLPNGQQRSLDYTDPQLPPTLRVRIQHCFGWQVGPRVLDGQLPLRLELLAPNDRPQQITDDLAGFWAGSYALVRKDLRGRYPKHPWPEDPATAPPLAPRRGKGG
ncbi:MAG: ATP-dependent helicase HrpB [Planctomycetota bacterium]|nr:MAG: ATP-dependent helicase HrpB [Planctomycetota bacterium]